MIATYWLSLNTFAGRSRVAVFVVGAKSCASEILSEPSEDEFWLWAFFAFNI